MGSNSTAFFTALFSRVFVSALRTSGEAQFQSCLAWLSKQFIGRFNSSLPCLAPRVWISVVFPVVSKAVFISDGAPPSAVQVSPRIALAVILLTGLAPVADWYAARSLFLGTRDRIQLNPLLLALYPATIPYCTDRAGGASRLSDVLGEYPYVRCWRLRWHCATYGYILTGWAVRKSSVPPPFRTAAGIAAVPV
jgi:hypothetical protein